MEITMQCCNYKSQTEQQHQEEEKLERRQTEAHTLKQQGRIQPFFLGAQAHLDNKFWRVLFLCVCGGGFIS